MTKTESSPAVAPLVRWTTQEGLQVACYALPLERIPADFYADPDGSWSYESLARGAGFAQTQGVAIGALRDAFLDHPAGSAVVTLNAEARPYVAIVECPIAFTCAAEAAASRASAA